MWTYNTDYLAHHGIKGQQWGKRNGPPYPLSGGDYSASEKKHLRKKSKFDQSAYNKKHYDTVLKKDKTTLSTLSYDPNRTKGTDMFYAAHKSLDKHQYNALFNRPAPRTIYDKDGNELGTGMFLKYRINNTVNKDIKVASEDSAAKIFTNLYNKDRDFYNFVTDKDRLRKYFVDDKYKFKGYREARKVLEQLDNGKVPSSNDLQTIYRMFNYVIPYDGAGTDARGANDVLTQRTKFFKAAKEAGYGALLDTNDALYGGFKLTSPVIVFDMESVVPKDIQQTKMSEKKVSELILVGRKALGI